MNENGGQSLTLDRVMNQYFETALLLKLRIALHVQFQWMPPTHQIKFRSQVNRYTAQKKNPFYLSNVKGWFVMHLK